MTERLTDKNPCIKCERPINCGACAEPAKWISHIKKKLTEYETAEEEGRLVVLPCKPGTVYVIESDCAQSLRCNQGYIGKCGRCEYFKYYIHEKRFTFSEILSDFKRFGKTVFVTREEAEKALEEIKKGVMTYQ